MEDGLPPPMTFPQQQQRSLIHPIRHAVIGDMIQGAPQARRGGVEICDV